MNYGYMPNQYGQFNGFNQMQQNQQYIPNMQRSSIIRVSGWDSANSYVMPPNSETLLLDQNEPIVYLRTSDGGGYCTTKAYTITPLEQAQNNMNNFEERLRKVEEYINEQSNLKSVKRKQTDE